MLLSKLHLLFSNVDHKYHENNHNLDIDRLYVSEVYVGKAMVMKRFHARARGRGAKILKPFSKMEIIVRESEEE